MTLVLSGAAAAPLWCRRQPLPRTIQPRTLNSRPRGCRHGVVANGSTTTPASSVRTVAQFSAALLAPPRLMPRCSRTTPGGRNDGEARRLGVGWALSAKKSAASGGKGAESDWSLLDDELAGVRAVQVWCKCDPFSLKEPCFQPFNLRVRTLLST